MTLLQSGLIGAQRPVYQHLPPDRASSAGREAIDLAASVGLILDDWQQWVCLEALSERANGRWSAFEVALFVARQNGKNAILEAVELAGLFLWGEKLIVHSAHQFDTAQEHFLRMQELIETSSDLSRKVKRILTGNGKESIILHSGQRLKFKARQRGGVRGFTADRIVFDEAYDLPTRALGNMIPTLATRPMCQVWYTTSAPHETSEVAHRLQRRGRGGDAGRFFYADWCNEPGADPADKAARARANPGYNIRIFDEFMDDELLSIGPEEFARERLGIPDEALIGAGVFGPSGWADCADSTSKFVKAMGLALDVAPDMASASFAVCGSRADDLPHVEIADRRAGTSWVVGRAGELSERWGLPVWLDARGPVGGLVQELEQAKVRFEALPDGDMTKACAALQEKVLARAVRHISQPALNQAVMGASVRTSGDSWRWGRTSSEADISPLVAVTVALWVASMGGPKVPHFYT